MSIYVVIGAKGGTGAQIVKRLSEITPKSTVAEVRCLIRDPTSLPDGHLLLQPEIRGDTLTASHL